MKSTFAATAALVRFATAQSSYGAAESTTTYACNPAHSYPNGAQCISTAGSLTLVTTSASATPSGFACNPAHIYPNGASCISTAGSLTLVTPSTSASASSTSFGFACNPAHSYPNGASCISTAGSLTLVTPSASASASTTYACNPAHSYPNGASCVSTAGSLTLVTPTPSASTTYACNPAHSYPNGASCISTEGSLTIVTPSASASASASGNASDCYAAYNTCRVAPDANMASCAAQYAGCLGYNPFASNGTNTVTPASNGDVYVTEVVTSYTTYCPNPTTFAVNNKTYTVSSATTLTITDCPGGCKVTKPATALTTYPVVTAVVSSFTTYCPSPTTIVTKDKTYTVSSATTLTVTHCPGGCTVTTPVSAITSAPAPSGYLPPSGTGASGNSTVVGHGSSTTTPVPYTGAGAKLIAGGVSLVAAVAGVIFFL